MVCDAALVINLVSSVMMNGVCCIGSIGEEERRGEEQKDMIRKAINVEWQRLKLMEFERKQQIMQEHGLDQGSMLVEERRKLLIATKQRAHEQSSVATSRASVTSENTQLSILEDIFENKEFDLVSARRAGNNEERNANEKTVTYEFIDKDCLQKKKISVAQLEAVEPQRRVPLIIGVPSFVRSTSYSSLLDEDSDTESDFDEIQLQ
mmetsp:Transcript_24826/g.37733  ORF Transcript_24826/g.37733 Transcript_24826/m.37733 type:complete len:207 (-) Transcript_24826:884-1504(-)